MCFIVFLDSLRSYFAVELALGLKRDLLYFTSTTINDINGGLSIQGMAERLYQIPFKLKTQKFPI